MSRSKIALGITEDDVLLGSHLIHLWKSDVDFEFGVRLSAIQVPLWAIV